MQHRGVFGCQGAHRVKNSVRHHPRALGGWAIQGCGESVPQ